MELSINATLGERIRYYRQSAGLTQKQLAEACELSEPAIRNYELGNRIPDWETLAAIAQTLKVSHYALAEPDLTENYGAMHAFFRLEQIYGLKPVEIDGRILLEIEDAPSSDELVLNPMQAFDSPGFILSQTLRNWHKIYQEYKSGKMDRETYLRWQSQYPEQIGQDVPTISIKHNAKRMRKPKVK